MPSRVSRAHSGQFSVFKEKRLYDVMENIKGQIRQEINNEDPSYITNVNEDEYIQHFISRYTLEPVELLYDEWFADHYEKEFSASQLPRDFYFSRPGVRVKKQVFVYHIPIQGDKDLLKCEPYPTSLMWHQPCYIEDGNLCFEIANTRDDIQSVKQESEHILKNLRTQLGHMNPTLNTFNKQLENVIRDIFEARKSQVLQHSNQLASLGVPIKRRNDLPQTYAVPTPKKKTQVVTKPTVSKTGTKPEPTIDEGIYRDILKTINDTGKMFERAPATFKNMGEEDLRNSFLLQLEPRFEGSTTGETFNKSGKTDILMRHESNNLFIAECKFWTGEKGYHATISQLLNYLTWRDSKAAVIMFVRNKDFSSVLKKVEACTSEHQNYLRGYNKSDEAWYDFVFHLNDDRDREVKVAVMLFHIPGDD